MKRQYKKGKTKGSLLYFFQIRAKNLELILLGALFGLSAIILMGKYLDLRSAVTIASEQAFFGNLKSSLLLFADEKIAKTGRRTFPDPQSPLLARLLHSVHDDWSYKPIDETMGVIEYKIGDKNEGLWYYSIGPSYPDSTEFLLVRGMTGLHPFKGESSE
ncbi:MAG: hypothetical protein ACE5D7_00410 [Fidelibacterota bacterium]